MFKIYGTLILFIVITIASASTYEFTSDGYLKATEMNINDTLIYHLKNSEKRTFVLKSTAARPVFTFDNPNDKWESGRIFTMTCTIEADGQEFKLQRFVPAQQSLYVPWHINGVTLFFDACRNIEKFIKDSHAKGKRRSFPEKDARFAFIEYKDGFASQKLRPWYPNKKNYINIEECYEGGDTWIGAFKKDEAHNGFDVNLPNNTTLWAPVDFDDQYYFNSLKQGHSNNRWKGIKIWPNGEKWILRSHHMTRLSVDQHTPLKQGQKYGEVGGVHYGSHTHVHFFFKWIKNDVVLKLDPWILLWKIFENNREKADEIKAVMNKLSPVSVGEPISLDGKASRKGITGQDMKYYWTTSDGAFYEGPGIRHKFKEHGAAWVNLLVTNGTDSSSVTQHLTVTPGKQPEHWLTLSSGHPFDLKRRTMAESDMYGKKLNVTGNYLDFYYRKNAKYDPSLKEVSVNADQQTLKSLKFHVDYLDKKDWLQVQKNNKKLKLNINKEKLDKAMGTYQCVVNVYSDKTGLRQHLYVNAVTPCHEFKPDNKVIVDESRVKYFPSRFYWLENPYEHDFLKGYNNKFRVWGGNNDMEGIARYQPDLQKGRYKISLHPEAIIEPSFSENNVEMLYIKIKTADGIKMVKWHPKKNKTIGTFELLEGKESYIDVITSKSKGLICLDALVFEKISD